MPLLSMQRNISTVAPPLTQSATPALLMVQSTATNKSPSQTRNAAFAVVQLTVLQLHIRASTDEQPEVVLDSLDLSLHS